MNRSVPVADAYSLQRVCFLCARMKGSDHYINEKASRIETLATDYFSARKHWRYQGGADGVHAQIRDLLGRIRSQCQMRMNPLQP